ncbi:MAG TPA: serine/threonine-protein kinase [Chitinivibrionales bacterium]|nr:serine/threonine-protein kinase [Chitinivibrionales bacterium]
MIPKLPKGFSHPMRAGEGAFASVYRVRQTALDRWVAIKMLHEKDPAKKRDLVKEANTQARIQAPCIPQVFHVFEWRSQVCIVMEWVKGASLSSLLSHFPSPEERLWLADHVIRSLAAVHTLGFAHRDLKPENILVSPDKGVMFVDFGFTKSMVDGQQSVAGVVKGTPAFMAPELWSGKRGVDPLRCDVFAAGRVIRDVVQDPAFAAFVDQCTHEDPSRRPASGAEMLAQWERVAPHVTQPDWKRLAKPLSSEQLSLKLAAAARQLLRERRHDEAYWLLVESIEENPKNNEAISLMNSFPGHVRRQRMQQRISIAAAIAACVCLLLFAFVAGRSSRDWDMRSRGGTVIRQRHDGSALLASSLRGPAADAAGQTVPLRIDSSSVKRLCGTLFLAAKPAAGKLSVDGKPVVHTMTYSTGITLSFGRHTLCWLDDNGRITWREKINLLPFEAKIVSVNAQ